MCQNKRWLEIGRVMGLAEKTMTSLSHMLMKTYRDYLLAFEEFVKMQELPAERCVARVNSRRERPDEWHAERWIRFRRAR